MAKYSKYNIVYRLQKWMDSVPGQTFLNYAYSWGASIVILGALFKLTHLAGADLMLYLGMGTEAFVFFLSAFDRPFDKTADGMDLPTHLGVEGVQTEGEEGEEPAVAGAQPAVQGVGGGGTIIIGGAPGAPASGEGAAFIEGQMPEPGSPEAQAAAIAAASGGAINVPFVASQSINPEMTEVTNNYVEELKKLTEVLEKVAEQSKRLTTDSEEMENLNRTLTGICKIYEMQLKTASQQMGTGDEINARMQKMASQIEELNRIYTRMIEAMTVNMPGAKAPEK